MKSSALSLLLCLLLLPGCAAPVERAEAPGPSLHDASPSTAPPEQAQAIRLPASIDPVGFTRDPDVLQMDIADLAAKYGAKDPTMPDLYEIHDYILGDYEARLFIQTNAGKVRQIVAAQTQEVPTSAFEDVYLSMVEELGQPDEAFGENSYCEFVSITPDNLLTHTGEVMARWYLEDRIFEIGEEIVGSQPSKWYVAAYVDRLNHRTIYAYPFGNDCCPHGASTYFDPLGIYHDPELFTAQAQTILADYGAQTVCATDLKRTSPSEAPAPVIYVVDGLKILDHAAFLFFYPVSESDPRIAKGRYLIPLDDVSPQDAMVLFQALQRTLDTALGAENRRERLEDIDINNSQRYIDGMFSLHWSIEDGSQELSLIYTGQGERWASSLYNFYPTTRYIEIFIEIL